MKKAVVVLTRGYDNINQYNSLIQRNISIAINLRDKINTPIIIFHEGNISSMHQDFISKKTPLLNISFVDVKIQNKAFKDEKSNLVFYPPTNDFKLGYRHMCSFWFVNFFDYVNDFDYILRIDEDCIVNCNIDNIFLQLTRKTIVYGTWVGDDDFVTKGLNRFTLHFINKNKYNLKKYPRLPSGPYTNVIGFNMNNLRQNQIIQQYIQEIKFSNCIYIYRWGDLPLWGEVIHYFLNKNEYAELDEIKYYHGSHRVFIK
jgi:hypothetical protein